MEISYKRDLNHNFMIIQCDCEASYELKMVCKNKIKGLLNAHTNMFNGSCEIYYDISSKQPIDRIYGKKEMDAEDLRILLLSIKMVIEETGKFLLDINHVLFSPELCYCNPEEKRLEWVFYPGNESGGLSKMAEFVIDRVNHSDSNAVDAAYKFFKLIKSNIISVGTIENILEEMEIKEAEQNVESDSINYTEIIPDMPRQTETVRQQDTIANKLKNKVKDLWRSKINADKKGLPDVKMPGKEVRWETYGLDEPESFNGETVVMGMNVNLTEHRLRNVKKTGDFVYLDKLPCVFGKLETCADIVLSDNSVSRVHAQIFEDKGELYLQDLNSTNGSYVNSLAVENNEIVRLKSGDEIAFGNVRYIYE